MFMIIRHDAVENEVVNYVWLIAKILQWLLVRLCISKKVQYISANICRVYTPTFFWRDVRTLRRMRAEWKYVKQNVSIHLFNNGYGKSKIGRQAFFHMKHWYAALRKCSYKASTFGGSFSRVTLFFVKSWKRSSLMSVEAYPLSYRRQTYLIAASVESAKRSSVGISPKSNIDIIWFMFAFRTPNCGTKWSDFCQNECVKNYYYMTPWWLSIFDVKKAVVKKAVVKNFRQKGVLGR